MRRIEPQSIGDILREAIEASQVAEHLDEMRAAEQWPLIVGDEIAGMCMRPFVKAGQMTVRVPDASLRHELMMHKSNLLRDLNRFAGKEVIKSLRFTS